MTFLYWNIGKNITESVLNNKKAEYGKSVIKELSKRLVINYGRGFSVANIFRMLKFYEYFCDYEKFSTLSRKLSWSHFVELLQISDKIKRAPQTDPTNSTLVRILFTGLLMVLCQIQLFNKHLSEALKS